MRQSLAFVTVLASAVMAADTISFYFPGGSEGVDPVATIKEVQPSTTKFNIACPTGVDSNDCGWGPGLDYTILSNTKYEAQMSFDSISMSYACDHNTSAKEMTCTVSMVNQDVKTAVLKGTDVVFDTATIVSGASLLSGSASATPASGANSAASQVASLTGSAKPAQNTGAAASLGVQTSALLVAAGTVIISVL